mmetsp:Transcript_5340/g.7935  ORF Transcript_5340/g.7935 Transcript_5340/m.7935 type:complete len:165 (+) Transcript_5340:2280-2774(+)
MLRLGKLERLLVKNTESFQVRKELSTTKWLQRTKYAIRMKWSATKARNQQKPMMVTVMRTTEVILNSNKSYRRPIDCPLTVVPDHILIKRRVIPIYESKYLVAPSASNHTPTDLNNWWIYTVSWWEGKDLVISARFDSDGVAAAHDLTNLVGKGLLNEFVNVVS